MKYKIVKATSTNENEAIQVVERQVNELLKYRKATLRGGVSVAVNADDIWLVCQVVMVEE